MTARALIAIAALALPTFAQAGGLADIEIYDRTSGRTLAIHEHRGQLYVAGEPQHQYELRIRNHSAGRVLAVTSVDGVNVITGETAAEQQSGYVIGASDSVAIEGWRKSLDDVAVFYFTRLRDSYAARTGRPHDVGVIGVALFSERQYCCAKRYDKVAEADAAPAAAGARQSAPHADESLARRESRLGTGHGHREASPAQYVDFEFLSGGGDMRESRHARRLEQGVQLLRRQPPEQFHRELASTFRNLRLPERCAVEGQRLHADPARGADRSRSGPSSSFPGPPVSDRKWRRDP